MSATYVHHAKRLVVKIGSSLVASSRGGLRVKHLAALARDLAAVKGMDRQVVVVSSGAIVAGLRHLRLSSYPKSIPLQQAAAAVGQSRLMSAYEQAFQEFGHDVAQILLTHQDLTDRKRFLNARHTLTSLLERDIIPVINENDTVSVDEIRFGDNDTLAGQVAHLVDADLLVILSDVDGLYSADPRVDSTAALVPLVRKITKTLEQSAGRSRSQASRGGMITKLQAAKHVTRFGAATLLLNGTRRGLLPAVLKGREAGTLFLPHGAPLTSRKQWIAFTLRSQGRVTLDEGAVEALRRRGKSLLPSGVVSVHGQFHAGDPVSCVDHEGQEFAKGLVNYSAPVLRQIQGCNTKDIAARIGSCEYDEVIHRDNLVLL